MMADEYGLSASHTRNVLTKHCLAYSANVVVAFLALSVHKHERSIFATIAEPYPQMRSVKNSFEAIWNAGVRHC
jgi:hypothetical protein